MDSWKAEVRRVRRDKIQMRERVRKSRNTVFFQWFGAPEGRKVGSLKRRVRSQLARWEMKNCTPLWRKAHVQVKMYKTHHSRTTFGSWDDEKVHAVVARSTFPSQNAQNTRGADHFWRFRCRFASLHYNTLHYTTLHYLPLHYTTTTTTQLHSTTLKYTTPHCITLHHTPLHYITLHYTPQHYKYNYTTTLHYTPLHSITLHYITLHYTPLHYIALHYLPLHFTTLHYTTLHYTTNTTTTTQLHPLHSTILTPPTPLWRWRRAYWGKQLP